MIKKILKLLIDQINFETHVSNSLKYKNFNETLNFMSSKVFGLPKQIKPPKKKKIIVLAPHPDDEMFGPGGTLLMSKETCKIKIIYMTSGRNKEEYTERESEAEKICKQNNFERIFIRHSQNFKNLDSKVKEIIFKNIIDFKPQIIFTPFITDEHNDHQNINEIFLELENIRGLKIWCYQVYSLIKGNFFVDISDFEEHKRMFIRLYKSELKVKDWENWIISHNIVSSRYMPRSKKKKLAEMFLIFEQKFYKRLCGVFFKKNMST